MKKIYISGNYVIIEKDGKTYEYAVSKTVYTLAEQGKTGANLTIVETNVGTKANGRCLIYLTELAANEWFQEDGLTNWTEATLTTFLRENTGFNPASGGSGATVLTEIVELGATEFSTLRTGHQLLPTPTAGTWQDVKEIIYKFKGNTTPYFGLDEGNVFAIFGGGAGVKYQIYTNVDVFKQPPGLFATAQIWKQYPQTRENYNALAFNPAGVLQEPPYTGLIAYFTRENLLGGDGVLELEITYEVKTI